MRTIYFVIFIMSFLFCSPYARAEMYHLKPLTLFHPDDAVSLGLGSLESISINPDLYHPGELLEFKDQVSIWYERESVLNETDSKLSSSSKGAFGLFHSTFPVLGKSVLAFSVSDFESNYRVSEDNEFDAAQNINEKTFAFGVRPHPIIFLGAGVRILSGKSQTEEFYQISVSPVNNLSFGYRQYVRDIEINTSLSSNEQIASLELNPKHEIRELTFRTDVPSVVLFNAELNINSSSESYDITCIFFKEKPLNVIYRNVYYALDYLNAIAIDGSPGGHVNIDATYSSKSLSLQFTPVKSSRRIFIGIKRTEFTSDMAGKVNAENILSFWEDLLAGDRFFNADYSFESFQYHLGIEHNINTRLILRGGFQYIDVKPDGELEHWTPFPITKIGKLDREVIPFPYSKASFAGLSAGFSFFIGQFQLSYGISQLIPITITEVDQDGGESTADTSVDTGSLFSKDPGGNLQKIHMTWYF